MRERGRARLLMAVGAILLAAAPAAARVKLATLPVRERVVIQLENGQHTLVEEERIVPLLKSTAARGNNQIDFSWASTQIDKATIQFRPLGIRESGRFRPIGKVGGQDEVAVISVAYPPNENSLVWDVYAAESCAVQVRVSYLLGNLTRSFSYRAQADKDEKFLGLRKFLEVHNQSGERYDTAELRAGFGPSSVKEVGQPEDTKILLQRFERVPITKTFTFDWYANGPLNAEKPLCSKVLMHYALTNDRANGLGQFPLQPGKVRIFIDHPPGGEAFLGEDRAEFTPLDGTMRLYLGEAQDIVCQRVIEKSQRHPVNNNLVDQEVVLRYEIENFKDKPVTLSIVEQINRVLPELAQQSGQSLGDTHGEAQWENGPSTDRRFRLTFEQGRAVPVLRVDLPARSKDPKAQVEKTVARFHFTLKNVW